MSDEMLERVGRALALAIFGSDAPENMRLTAPWAYAAISAMRQPTEAMMRAMLAASANDPNTMDIWQAGIAAALGET